MSKRYSVVSDALRSHGLYSPWNSPGLAFPFSNDLPNPGIKSHCRHILYQLSHKGNPRILEWVAYPFSSGSSQPRNRTEVSCVTGRFSTNWAIREALVRAACLQLHFQTKYPHMLLEIYIQESPALCSEPRFISEIRAEKKIPAAENRCTSETGDVTCSPRR